MGTVVSGGGLVIMVVGVVTVNEADNTTPKSERAYKPMLFRSLGQNTYFRAKETIKSLFEFLKP